VSARLGPRVVIELRLEGRGRAFIEADSFEDEGRLRVWLSSGGLAELRRVVARLLAELDSFEENVA
jgi:hypothetical protein